VTPIQTTTVEPTFQRTKRAITGTFKEYSMKRFHQIPRTLASVGMVALAVALLSAEAKALTKDELNTAIALYKQESAICRSTGFDGDVADCLKEARNSLADIKSGKMSAPLSASEYEKNAMLRCDVHRGVDKSACLARMRGEGRAEGSVASGGMLREMVVTIPAD
jgi:hypothetical protein